MKPRHLAALKVLALEGAVHEYVPLSTAQLGRLLGISQQSASVRVLDLLEEGLVTRSLGGGRQEIQITEKGMEVLRGEYAAYKRIFEIESRVRIKGRVERGLGEGFYYMSQEGYREQFRKKLGFDPYPGTLNLKLEGREPAKLEVLQDAEGVAIHGFKDQGREFGGAKCFAAEVGDLECAAILPHRSHYSDVLELISPHHLRSRLDLHDGALLAVTVRL